LDKRGELCERWGVNHRREGCPGVGPPVRRQIKNQHRSKAMPCPSSSIFRQARRAAAGFNTALEPTPITPGSFRFGFRVGGSHRRRGSAFGR
jgi:hypothetical protein